MKDYDKNKESSYLKYCDVNNLRGWVMSQKLPLDGFKWVENTSRFSKDFIEHHSEDSDTAYFIEVDVPYIEKSYNLHNDLSFFSEKMKIGKVENFVANFHYKKKHISVYQYRKKFIESLNSIKKLD